ncbi:MAG: cell envelope integrity protein CreD [Bacteroidota bacterium]
MENPQPSIQDSPGFSLGSIWNKGKLFVKAVFIFIMALMLWIPTNFTMELVRERQGRQKEAIADISNKWAGQQVVTSPILMIPYVEKDKNSSGDSVSLKHKAYFLSDKLEIQTKVFPEKRHRGIYDVIVYRSEITINGKFNPLAWQQLKIPAENFLWNEAVVLFKVKDNIKGINEDVSINWNGSSLVFNPQEAGLSHMEEAFAASIPFTAEDVSKEHSYSMKFLLNGSEKLLFTTTARENKLTMQSSWPDPGFTGIKIPDTRQVNDSGFTAGWKYMNRSVPQVWKDTFYDLSSSVLGADLLIPMDSYNKTERSVKYALLCIVLTFASFFLIETYYKRSLHLVQYGLAGLALVLFYTLLLSISEYTGFNPAYLISSVATIGLVMWFIGSIMKSSRLALFISFVLTVVYGYIFIIIQLQDYALLMGSIGLFIALAIIMYFSRKLQW